MSVAVVVGHRAIPTTTAEIETQTSQKSADEYLERGGSELAMEVNILKGRLHDVSLAIIHHEC